MVRKDIRCTVTFVGCLLDLSRFCIISVGNVLHFKLKLSSLKLDFYSVYEVRMYGASCVILLSFVEELYSVGCAAICLCCIECRDE